MATADSLQTAALQAYDNLYTWWLAGSLKTKVASFAAQVLIIGGFDDGHAQSLPVTSWAVILGSLASSMQLSAFPPVSTKFPFADLEAAAEALYKICWLTSGLEEINQVNAEQATSVLTAYNGIF
jgi:hypothetical protein